RGVLLLPARGLDDLDRVGRGHQHLRQQCVVVECDRRDELFELGVGSRPWLGSLLGAVLGRSGLGLLGWVLLRRILLRRVSRLGRRRGILASRGRLCWGWLLSRNGCARQKQRGDEGGSDGHWLGF